MFKAIRQVLKEQFKYRDLIFRMASFEVKGTHQIHYLGSFWQFLNPAIQIAIYWFVFGIGLRGGADVGNTPFFLWLIIGLIPWFFIAPTVTQGSNSVHQKIGLVSKMNFPVSLLPTIRIVSNSYQFFAMLALLIVVSLLYRIPLSIYTIQIIYYTISMYVFLFAFALVSSTISTLIRDFQVLLQSLMRMLFYLTPILWSTDLIIEKFNKWGYIIENILKLNPFYYIIEGFRDSILGRSWFFEDPIYMGYFWVFTFALLYFGSMLHLKFRKNFMDYM
ncbi:ABC transporter permease [Agaribacter marinus]|uniref:Transport permease protein n=1 Tax=Virgibacillus salarius TaxID=447199 RepID=A0A941DY21_9BACI|nr:MULTISPECIES: ABC transporter permease [Bacillaceae]MBR7797662.1 ABC transporter permease [Virgibacillus salarius]NAZ10372.1 ABC transporter permease [Agaribacter marinus]WBX81932.1 ABC transporter permease [Virgibacillus salarius]